MENIKNYLSLGKSTQNNGLSSDRITTSEMLEPATITNDQIIKLLPLEETNYHNKDIPPQYFYYFKDSPPFYAEKSKVNSLGLVWKSIEACNGDQVLKLVEKIRSVQLPQLPQSIHINTGSHGNKKGQTVYTQQHNTKVSEAEYQNFSEGKFFKEDITNLLGIGNLSITPITRKTPAEYPLKANHVINAWCFSLFEKPEMEELIVPKIVTLFAKCVVCNTNVPIDITNKHCHESDQSFDFSIGEKFISEYAFHCSKKTNNFTALTVENARHQISFSERINGTVHKNQLIYPHESNTPLEGRDFLFIDLKVAK